MSSSSTTACSRSPSPATPATPESSDNLEAAIANEDLSLWCHSLPPNAFLHGNHSHLVHTSRKDDIRALQLEDLIQDDAYEDTTPSALHAPSQSFSHSLSFSATIDAADAYLHSRTSISSASPDSPSGDATSQCVVYPPKDSCSNLPIIVPSIPEGGTKSRVETQVRLTVDLAHASASSGEPLKYDRVGSWKWLRLPKGTSTKRRKRKESKIDAAPEDTLHLTAQVTCASPPHTRVTCCSSCQAREAKRVARKLAARVRPARSDSDSPDDVITIPGRGKHEDTSNLIQFNCPEVLDFSSGSIILPLRITCYCRHHREKVGFNVHFTMLDHNGRVVGSGTTRPIMITDDHKSTGVNANKSALSPSEALPSPEWPSAAAGSYPELSGPHTKRRTSRIDTAHERMKKRTKPYDGGRPLKIPRNMSNGSLDSTPSTATSAFATRAPTPAHIEPSSPLHSHVGSTGVMDPASAEMAASIFNAAFEASVSPIDTVAQNAFREITMPDSRLVSQGMSFQDLTNPAFLPNSPTHLPLSVDPSQTLHSNPPVSYLLFNHDPSPPSTGLPPPKIHRLIPSSGPTYGGIEVTVLGANFHPAMQLNCVFGDVVSSSTHRWSDNTLVCLLPPSPSSGVVAVWFDGINKEDDGSPAALFTYTDETDRALMELALQVVGLKMTGKIEDARNVAMRIVSNTAGADDSQNNTNSNMAMQLALASNSSSDLRHLLLSRAGDSDNFETLILDFLAILDSPTDVPTASVRATISLPTQSGQTLLHLATFLNFPSIVRFLLAHEIDLDARDRNGYTALHFAATIKSTACAKLLLDAGASTDVVNALGKTPAEIAPAGFLDSLSCNGDIRDRNWGLDEREDEEATWADIEETDDEKAIRPQIRRRSERHSHRKEKAAQSLPVPGEQTAERSLPNLAESKKTAQADAIVDEKQVIASIVDMVQRTLAQLQHPQAMIPQMPNLPIPGLSNLPGMSGWTTLPQMPTVFPVFIPIPALSAFWSERRAEQQPADGDKAGKNQPWLGIPNAQEWRGIWEKWVAMASVTARPNDEMTELPPPAYSPREGAKLEKEETIKESPEASSTAVTPALPSSSVERHVSRRVEYEEVPIPEQEVKSYGYRPTKKASRKPKKHDRMLVLFWIPILLIGIIWAFLHSVRVGFQAMRAVLTLKAGLRV